MPGTLLVFVISSNESHPYIIRLRDIPDVKLISLDIIFWCVLSILNFDNQIQCGTVIPWSIFVQIPTIKLPWPTPCGWDMGCLSWVQISDISSISITANDANLMHSIFCFNMFYVEDQVRYGAVITRSIFRPQPYNGPTSTRPWERDKGYLLWVQPLIYVLLQPLYGFMRYHIKLDRVTTAPDCIPTHPSIALHPSTAGRPAVLPQRSKQFYFGYRNKWKNLLHKCMVLGTLFDMF